MIEVLVALYLAALLSSTGMIIAAHTGTWIRQARDESKAAYIAGEVLETIRERGEVADLQPNLNLAQLGLSQPDNMEIFLSYRQHEIHPRLYVVQVQVKPEGGRGKTTVLSTMIRRTGYENEF